MLQRKLTLWTVCLVSLFFFSTSAQAIDPLKFNVTSDNAYRFGFGGVTGIKGIYDKYWFDHEWNNTVPDISAAETYPKHLSINHRFKSLQHDYFYVACFGGAIKAPYADVVVVIDESGSMSTEQQFTKVLITNLETKLKSAGIGNPTMGYANRYGLVGFGGAAPHQPGHPHIVGMNNGKPQLFGTTAQYCAAVDGLVDNGSAEDGYSGINVAISYPWRTPAAKIIILITDENRDDLIPPSGNQTADYTNILTALKNRKVTLNAIVTCDIRDNNGQSVMAIDSTDMVFTANVSGGYSISSNGSITDAQDAWSLINAPNTKTQYADLAHATGGLVGDFDSIKNVATTSYSNALATSFSNALAGQITAQAINKRPYRGMIAEVIAANSFEQPPFALQADKWEVYATGVAGYTNPYGFFETWSATNAPTWQQINKQIQYANNVNGPPGTSSQGWVNINGEVVNGAGISQTPNGFPVNSRGKLVTGENNSNGGGYFDIVSPMDQQTRWMWYNPNPATVNKPFETGLESDGKNDGAREFLIFRLPIKNLPPPCCDDCCDKFKVQFDKDKTVNLNPKTGNIDLSHFFTGNVDYNGSTPAPGSSDWRYVKQVNATIISSWKTCNGKPQSLGLNFQHPTPVPGWNSKLTSAFFSHEQTWERTTAKDPWFSLNQPLALTVPVSELKSAEAIGFCIKYTFIDSKCQICEKVVCYNYPLRQRPTRRSTLEEGKPTLASPEVPRDDTPKTNPSTSGPSRTSPSRTNPSRTNPSRTNPSRTNPSRTNPGRTDRPTIRRPVDLRPANLQRGAGRPLVTRPTDAKKDPRKPVVDQPADGKEAPQKSDREKPATKKPAERKEAEAKRGDDEPANRSVLLKK